MKRRIAKFISTLSLIGMLSSLGIYQIAFAAVQGQWPNSTTPSDIVISNNPPDENEQLVTRTSDGDYVTTFLLNGRSYAYKFSATDGSAVAAWNGGFPTIASSQLTAPRGIAPDNAGGVYVAQNIDFGGGNCDVLLQRLDSTGTRQFGFPGITITSGSGCEVFMEMIPDGSGGVYLAWGDGGASLNTFQTQDLYVTRVTSSGVVDTNWNTGGAGTWRPLQMPESQGGGTNDHSANIIADGTGNVIVAYESSIPLFYYAVTKFDANGNLAGAPWNTPLLVDDDNQGNRGRDIAVDGTGNVYFGFLAEDLSSSPDNIQVQKFNSAGAAQWGSGVTVVPTSADVASYSGQPRIVHDGSGGLLIAWHTDTDNEVYGHHVTSAGVLDTADSWASAPIALSNIDANTSWFLSLDTNTMLTDGAGGAYILYGSYEGGAWPVAKLQHLNSDGTVEFAGDGTTLATGAGIEGINPVMTSDGGTGVVTVFQDEGPSGMDLYAQHFDEGSSGGGSSGGSENSDATQEIICGALTLNVNANNDFQMTDLTVSNLAQDSFGTLIGSGFATPYQNGTNTLPEEAFIYVDDSRTVGTGPGCATDGVDEGWLVGVEATNFVDSGAIAPDIPSSNLYFLATTNVTPDTSYGPGFTEFAGGGDGSDTNLFYTTGYADTQDVEAPYNVADTTDLTTATPFTTENATLDSSRSIMENTSGAGTNDFKFTAVGTGIAYYLNVPENQAGGSYTSTLTITLIPST